MPNTLNRW